MIILYKDITVIYSKFGHIITKTYQQRRINAQNSSKRGNDLYEEFWDRSFDQNGRRPVQTAYGSVTNAKNRCFL